MSACGAPARLWRAEGALCLETERRSRQPAATVTLGTPQGRASATALCRALRISPSVSLSLSSRPAPLAEALPCGVPLGTRQAGPAVFLAHRYGRAMPLARAHYGRASAPELATRNTQPIAPRSTTCSAQAVPWPLLACAARRKGGRHFASRLCTPPTARSAAPLRGFVAIAGFAGRQRGRSSAPLGTPRLACRAHAAHAAPLVTPVKVSKTRTAGPDRWPAVVTVRGHRLLRLYRALTLHSASQCFKYLLGSGGGAPRPPCPVGSRLKIHPALLTLAPLRTSERQAKLRLTAV